MFPGLSKEQFAEALSSALQKYAKESKPADIVTWDDRVTTIEAMKKSVKPDVHLTPEIAKVAESINWLNPRLKWSGVVKMAVENYRKLNEAHSSTALSQLLRAGVQTIANEWYKRKPVGYPDYVLETTSDKRQEFYAPLYGAARPSRTGRGVPYKEQRVKGADREIINYKYMGGESFERELFDDDQTGQINQRAQALGEAMRDLEEEYVAGRFRGIAFTAGSDSYPASTFSTVNYNGTSITVPFSVNMYYTGSGNCPASYVQLSFFAMKTGYEQLLDARDPLGLKIAVNPDTVLVSGFDFLNVRTFLNSTWYPAVPGRGGETVANAASGYAGTQYAENVIRGLMNPAYNRYLPQGAWYMGEGKKGFVFQRRDPLEVVQELPQAGQSFDTDTYRFRNRARWEAEWLDSRFWYQGNDGTASVTQ